MNTLIQWVQCSLLSLGLMSLLLLTPAHAVQLQPPRTVTLTAETPTFRSPVQPLSAFTDTMNVTLQRPTHAVPLAWDADSTMRVSLVLVVDGTEYRTTGQVSGGIRMGKAGDVETYSLTYHPTVLFGSASRAYLAVTAKDATGFYPHMPLMRLGETGTVVQGYVLLEWVRGAVTTQILSAKTTESPAPTVRYKNSVAFDAATDIAEVNGDGVVSLTHTATGSDRAVFAGYGGWASAASTSVTYNGVSMTELWDITDGSYNNAGYILAAPATGAQTVTSTLACGVCNHHIVGVISFTGVDQTTPAGTYVNASGNSTTPTVTVTDVGADDMVVDNMFTEDPDGGTAGTDQTMRNTEIAGADTTLQQSTQPGSAGGVMSWTTESISWWTAAVAIKATAGASVDTTKFRLRVTQ